MLKHFLCSYLSVLFEVEFFSPKNQGTKNEIKYRSDQKYNLDQNYVLFKNIFCILDYSQNTHFW